MRNKIQSHFGLSNFEESYRLFILFLKIKRAFEKKFRPKFFIIKRNNNIERVLKMLLETQRKYLLEGKKS